MNMKFSLSIFFSICCMVLFTTNLSAQTAATSTNQTTISVKVTGVGCSTDVKTIASSVEKMAGVSSCVAAKRGAVTHFDVSYNPDMVCEDDIYQTVQATPGCKNPNDRPYRVKI
jgi:copper chaperone CopZ